MELSDGVVEARTRFTPSPLLNLDAYPAYEAANLLWNTLREIFILTPRTLKVIRRIIAEASAYSGQAYSDQKVFKSRLYNPVVDPLPAICLTGPAGVGKSTLLKAMSRLFDETDQIDAGGGHRLPMRTFFYYKVYRGCRDAQILQAFIESCLALTLKEGSINEPQSETVKSVTKALALAQRLASRDGIAAVILDELQFLTQSTAANTAVTKTLLEMTYLGPPLVFASNYDMVHRLKNRGQQDRDRLLSRHVPLLPEMLAIPEDFQAWKAYLEECIVISGGSLAFNPENDAEPLHCYTFGLRRKLLDLFRIAYGHARLQGRYAATMQDIEWAYCSGEYCEHRVDVEELISIQLGRPSSRKDLIFPFEMDAEETQIRMEEQEARHFEKVTDQATAASLSPAEKRSYVAAGGTVKGAKGSGRKPSGEKRKKAPPRTLESLLEGGRKRYGQEG
ncbi:ATP-binding protein [Chromobacterium sp. S0633]|uniref:ATP-binding protein n=1 Tax=Chromobacterium sp. S0633 TaxID=2957805 RepID=UPI00209CB04D|nr:ATP-binding protein [Chromobacterium sp. S0633]MCP1289670.1 ATP-binding protein [Chromobacterium sp. S0633]